MEAGQYLGIAGAAEVVATSVITLTLPSANVSVRWATNPFSG